MSNIPFRCPKCNGPLRGIVKVHNYNVDILYNEITGEVDFNRSYLDSAPFLLELFCINDDCDWFKDPRDISTLHMKKEYTDKLPY